MHLPKWVFHCESTPGRQTRLNAKPVSAADAPRIHLSVAVFNLLFLAKARPETQSHRPPAHRLAARRYSEPCNDKAAPEINGDNALPGTPRTDPNNSPDCA